MPCICVVVVVGRTLLDDDTGLNKNTKIYIAFSVFTCARQSCVAKYFLQKRWIKRDEYKSARLWIGTYLLCASTHPEHTHILSLHVCKYSMVWMSIHLHMFSNISTRVFVLPSLICLRVLYLSTPFLTFSAWMMSSRVCLESTLMEARSLVRACTHSSTQITG